ncbi:hypothetical protein M514_08545 [Trichuris suis]|uniref:Uncharacterized protein n=1 Tax=Trichuris suis TaxID=68888 RepID=A0A085M050_9BILA|nr:hypothetical protein M513_08545 [Trichuris suis]KFD67689.1 hypothetical protein M514_08545 [Trichuris suis]
MQIAASEPRRRQRDSRSAVAGSSDRDDNDDKTSMSLLVAMRYLALLGNCVLNNEGMEVDLHASTLFMPKRRSPRRMKTMDQPNVGFRECRPGRSTTKKTQSFDSCLELNWVVASIASPFVDTDRRWQDRLSR